MEFHATTLDGVETHICTVHRRPKDVGPVQIISDAPFADYQAVEAANQALLQSLVALLAVTALA